MNNVKSKAYKLVHNYNWQELGYIVLSFLLALVIGGILLAILGYNPWETYSVIFEKAFTDYGQVLRRSTPLILSALAVAIPLKCGMFNLGGEGQLLTGAFAAAICGAGLKCLPIVIHPIVAILAAMLAGGFIGWLSAWIKIKFGAPEIVITLMLNYVISYVLEYLTNYVFRGSSTSPRTAYVQETAKIPMFGNQQWGVALLIAIAMCFLFAFIMNRTTFGLELKSSGLNQETSRYLGINVASYAIASLAIGGALAGMGGALEVLGGKYSYYQGYFDGYGFDGVAISYMAMGNPIGIIFTTIIISIFRTGMAAVERSVGVSAYFGTALQGIIITFLVCPYIIRAIVRFIPMLKNKISGRKVKKA